MFRRSLALLLLIAGLLLSAPATVRAETVLFACSESCPISLFEALELELRGHGVFLVARLSPSGFSVEAHEADARRMAGLVPVAAVVWIEREPPLRVRVFSPRESAAREAPLSTAPEQIDPRSFAAIAGNVVLQALGAPGHTDSAPAQPSGTGGESTRPSAPPAAGAPTTPVSATESETWPKRSGARLPRFFLRAGATFGFAFLKSGMRVDRVPDQAIVDEAARQQQQQNSPEAGSEYLRANGYDCDWGPKAGTSQYIAANCNAVLDKKGAVFAPGLEIQAGGYPTERLTLAGLLRIALDAGMGTLNHTLFGLQAEYALLAPAARGFWLNAGLGLAVGRIQEIPSPKTKRAPYVTSGLGEAHVLASAGYKFVPNFGVYTSTTLRYLFPDTMWMLEPTLGLEGRL